MIKLLMQDSASAMYVYAIFVIPGSLNLHGAYANDNSTC